MVFIPVISLAYDAYFSSGLYDTRYPRPNAAMVRLIRSARPVAGGAALDFGCGNGRYLPFLLEHPPLVTTAYDVSTEAVATCRLKFAPEIQAGRLRLVLGATADLTAAVEPATQDLVLLLFGVLGHVRGRAERIATLRALYDLLRPGGRLMLTVPSRLRRFRAEQALCAPLVREGLLEPGDILYHRQMGGVPLELYYHLFTPNEFLDELAAAGFVKPKTFAESVLSERASIASGGSALIDEALRWVCPLRLAYGFGALVERPLNG
jgi:SAM-dependent methyltransferase